MILPQRTPFGESRVYITRQHDKKSLFFRRKSRILLQSRELPTMNRIESSKSLSKSLMILVPLILLATWIGMRGLDIDSLWLDEYLSIYHAGGWYKEPRNLLTADHS